MTEGEFSVPRVGVSLILLKHGKVLMGRRKGAHGEGTWAFPGGHVELGEHPIDTAYRELKEETGNEWGVIELSIYRPTPYASSVFSDGKHYITLFFYGLVIFGEPKLMEPDKCEGWVWHNIRALPTPLFDPVKFIELI
jgi:8-oxo-dGTP diphosphatase